MNGEKDIIEKLEDIKSLLREIKGEIQWLK